MKKTNVTKQTNAVKKTRPAKKINTKKIGKITEIVTDEMESEEQSELLEDLRGRFQRLELNLKTRKAIAKKLSIDEKKAMNWRTVGDIFAFLDTSSLAKDHPDEAAHILKLVAGIIGAAFPPALVITGVILVLPTKVAAMLVEYLGKPTPEHMIHSIADRQAEKFEGALLEAGLKDEVEEALSEAAEAEEAEGELPYGMPQEFIDVEFEEVEEEEPDGETQMRETGAEDTEDAEKISDEEIRIEQKDIDIVDSFELLYTLYQRGILTEEEFTAKKKEMLEKLV